ncbi:MAG: hypothetical protein ACXWDN_05275 [Limisphaerales bacterium]
MATTTATAARTTAANRTRPRTELAYEHYHYKTATPNHGTRLAPVLFFEFFSSHAFEKNQKIKLARRSRRQPSDNP